ncbi:MAG: hypothetical protein FJ100_06260 [Deltaproteobacteria bacterium]|nr:hypothetical protein [Deltaproteobacteria bacterium]
MAPARICSSSLLAAVATFLCSACVAAGGGGGGGGGTGTALGSGGAPGAVCNPATAKEGCFGKARMACDAGSAKWVQVEICPADQVCSENAAGGGSSLIVTSCKPAGNPGVADAGPADGGTTAADGSTTTGPGDAPSVEVGPPLDAPQGPDTVSADQTTTPDTVKEVVVVADSGPDAPADTAETISTKLSQCLSLKCTQQWSACGADNACIAFLQCGEGCKDLTCLAQCAQKNFSEQTILLAQCAETSGCLAGGAGFCGDGKCAGGETSSSCPQDCGSKPVCGNGKCESGETSSNCAKDCGSSACCASKGAQCGYVAGCPSNCGTCPSGQTCTNNQCKGGSTGDCLKDKCGSQLAACQADQGCLGIWAYGAIAGCAEQNGCQDNACLQANCQDQLDQCNQIAACGTLVTCLGKCAGDQTCANNCAPAAGLAKYQAMGECYKTNCAP